MIEAADYLYFVDDALEGMVSALEELGDERVNRRLAAPGSNSPYAVVTHCLGVVEYWAGHLVAGRPSHRDREAEFTAAGGVAELVGRVRRARDQLAADVAGAEFGAVPRRPADPDDAALPIGRTQGGAFLHVYEELAQHRGQLEITRDLLLAAHDSV
ncbi:MAG: DUF664 domain-containing protein [Actinobacteria bacterium]|nr:DUF664 domain-containing protein [Actinomycetota bacterium]